MSSLLWRYNINKYVWHGVKFNFPTIYVSKVYEAYIKNGYQVCQFIDVFDPQSKEVYNTKD